MASFITAVILIFIAEQLFVRVAGINLKPLPSWSKAVWRWLCRGKDVLGGAFVIIFCVVICWLLDWSNAAFILTGCTLELAGITQAVISILEVRQYFKLPRLRDLFQKWVEAYPKIKKQPNTNAASVAATYGASCSNISLGICPGEIDRAQPLNEKVDLLVTNINQLTQRYEEQFFIISELMQRLNNVPVATSKEIKAMQDKIRKESELLHVGDFTPTLIGLGWIAAGTIMGVIGSLL